jgi:hypothetical protein
MEELILRVKEAIEFWVEEMEYVCAYDITKACGGEIIPFEQAVSEIERVRCKTRGECLSSIEVKI